MSRTLSVPTDAVGSWDFDAPGPGNVVMVEIEMDDHTEVFTDSASCGCAPDGRRVSQEARSISDPAPIADICRSAPGSDGAGRPRPLPDWPAVTPYDHQHRVIRRFLDVGSIQSKSLVEPG